MAETNSDIKIGSDWVSINTLTGIDIGEAVVIQNTGSPGDIISLWIGSEPLADEIGIALDQIKAFLEVPANNSEIWARYYRVDNKNVGAKLVTANVQLLDGAIIPGSPSGLVKGIGSGIMIFAQYLPNFTTVYALLKLGFALSLDCAWPWVWITALLAM